MHCRKKIFTLKKEVLLGDVNANASVLGYGISASREEGELITSAGANRTRL